MESKFQFSNPALICIDFKLNENFESHGKIKIKTKMETKIDRKEKEEAIVKLCVWIGEKSSEMPFYIYAEETAKFKWDSESYDEDAIRKLLNQNAPSLLLSYLRPMIANITGASLVSAYNIPFMNFTEK